MGVHATGTGSGWDEASPDVDQPHGLDYREQQDIRKGVRKRIAKEHATFADATAGGEHKPGGSAVLGHEDATADMSTGFGDPSYIGRGLIWCYSGSAYGALWCATGDGTSHGDPTILKIHPDIQWAGGCVTWSAGHEFDASVDITGNVAIDGDLTVDGGLLVDGTANFGDSAAIVGDLSVTAGLMVDGTVQLPGCISIATGDADGEPVHFGQWKFNNVAAATASGANDSEGSITFPNGTIMKWGSTARVSDPQTITFAVAFPNACFQVIGIGGGADEASSDVVINTITKTGFIFESGNANVSPFRWFAIGR